MSETICPSCQHALTSYNPENQTWWCGAEYKEVRLEKPAEAKSEGTSYVYDAIQNPTTRRVIGIDPAYPSSEGGIVLIADAINAVASPPRDADSPDGEHLYFIWPVARRNLLKVGSTVNFHGIGTNNKQGMELVAVAGEPWLQGDKWLFTAGCASVPHTFACSLEHCDPASLTATPLEMKFFPKDEAEIARVKEIRAHAKPITWKGITDQWNLSRKQTSMDARIEHHYKALREAHPDSHIPTPIPWAKMSEAVQEQWKTFFATTEPGFWPHDLRTFAVFTGRKSGRNFLYDIAAGARQRFRDKIRASWQYPVEVPPTLAEISLRERAAQPALQDTLFRTYLNNGADAITLLRVLEWDASFNVLQPGDDQPYDHACCPECRGLRPSNDPQWQQSLRHGDDPDYGVVIGHRPECELARLITTPMDKP